MKCIEMKKFNNLIIEAPDDDEQPATSKRALVNLIATNLFRLTNTANAEDTRGLLLLIAALSVLNVSDDPQSINTARRLAGAASSIKPRKGN
jgi:hypothetical protein